MGGRLMERKALSATVLLASLVLGVFAPAIVASAAASTVRIAAAPSLVAAVPRPSVLPGGNWTLLGTQPPGRDSPGWAYDSRADRFILFGGSPSGTAVINSTWSFDYTNNTWTNITPVVGPAPRTAPAMVYDVRADRIILFGGLASNLAGFGDTWIFDYTNDTWTNRTSGAHPSARGASGYVYDPTADRTILFSGFAGTSLPADTWIYDLGANGWTQRGPPGAPTGRYFASMVYDTVARASLLFGGVTLSGFSIGFSNETFSYDYTGNVWTRVTTTLSPPGRGGAGMAYDALNERTILFGGANGLPASSIRNDTWVYSFASHNWANLTPTVSPSRRVDTALAFDSKAGRTVLFGGSQASGGTSDEAWSYEFNAALPSAPRNLAAVAGASQVTLTWAPPSSDGGSAVTNYSIYRGTTSGGELLFKTVGPVLTYTDTAVTVGTTYFYQVGAVTGAGTGPRSNEAHATPVAADTTPPMILIQNPVNNSIFQAATGSVILSVFGVASDNVAVQSVELSRDGTTWFAANGTTTWHANVTLAPGTHTIYARATDTSGNRAETQVTVIITPSLQGIANLVLVAIIVGVLILVAVVALVVYLVVFRKRRLQPPPMMPPQAPPPSPPTPPPGAP